MSTNKVHITAPEFPHLLALFDAWKSLISLGWTEPRYFHFPPENYEFEMITLGSTGIHRAVVRGLDPEKTCWVDYEWPEHPFLVRSIGKPSQTRSARQGSKSDL